MKIRKQICKAFEVVRKNEKVEFWGNGGHFNLVEVVIGVCIANCPMCHIEEMRYNSSVMNFEKFNKIVGSFGEGINKIRLFN